jgi:hypothetical protein
MPLVGIEKLLDVFGDVELEGDAPPRRVSAGVVEEAVEKIDVARIDVGSRAEKDVAAGDGEFVGERFE